MPKVLLFLLVFLTIVWAKALPKIETIADDYPYGIHIQDDWTRPSRGRKEHETVSIFQKGKLVDRIETFRVYPLYRVDLNGDGYRELIFKTFDGGRRFDWVILTLKPKFSRPVVLKDIAESTRIEEIGGQPKLVTWESYGAQFAAESASVQVVANFDGKRFRLDRAAMRKRFESLKVPEGITLLDFNQEGFLDPHKPRALIETMRYMAYGFYAGESDRALDVLLKTIRPVGRATLYLFLQEFVEELWQSRFWADIAAFNGWRDNDYEIIGDKVVDHYKTWDRDKIARDLFKRVLKKASQ